MSRPAAGFLLAAMMLAVPAPAPAQTGADDAGPSAAASPADVAVKSASETTVHDRGEFRFAVGPAPAFAQVREVADTWHGEVGAGPGDPWRNWLLDQQVDRRGGRYIRYEDRAYEATSTALLRDVGKISLSFIPQYQSLTIHRLQLRRDGRWQDRLVPGAVELARRETDFEQDLADGAVSALIVIDDVRVGDVVRVAYSVDGVNPIMGGHVATRATTAIGAPMLERHLRVLFDPDADIDVALLGHEEQVRRLRLAEHQELVVHQRSVAPIVDTDDYPVWYTPYPEVQIAPRAGWGDIVDWARPLYPDVADLPAELEARLAQWARLGATDAVAAVLRSVQDDVRYFGVEMGDNTHRPNPPALVWSRRYGDCKDKALLMSVLLRRLGIDAVPALVSTADGRRIAGFLPAATAFNHVIVRARVDGRTLWLDPTLTHQRGAVDQMDLYPYGLALPLAAGVDRLETVSPPASVDNRLTIVETVTPQADAESVELRIETLFAGEHAESFRRRLEGQRFARVADGYADYYRRRYGKVDVVSPTTFVDDDATNRIRIVEHYRLHAPWVRAGIGRSYDTWASALADGLELPQAMARSTPLRLRRPDTVRHEIHVRLPDGWSVSTPEGRLAADGGPARYTREIRHGDDSVAVFHELVLARDHVAGDEIDDYLSGLRESKDAAGVRLAFRLPSAEQGSERSRRLQNLLRGSLDPEKKDAE